MISKETILLYVEDEENIMDEMLEIFELDFEHVYSAQNGKIALELYEKYHPNLIISDIQMPVMDGIEMSKEIRKIDKDTKIILMTAFSKLGYSDIMNELDINEFITKPVDLNKLYKSIDKCIK